MHALLQYPFDSPMIRRKQKAIRRELLQKENLIDKKVAVLGGSTTHDIISMLELFLLDYGIRPSFYESEYAQYWQDAMFGSPALEEFHPDLIFVHTSFRNITAFPEPFAAADEVNALLDRQMAHFTVMWEKLADTYHCPVIQNNFEMPDYRLMGNMDASDIHGRVHFAEELNRKFYEYAQSHDGFFINDIHYQSAQYGLEKWSDPFYWYMYKYALNIDAIPLLAFNVANIIKSIYGKNKKLIALDLDNTLWGGIVGDDGVDNLQLGQETSTGQAYTEFQEYLKNLQKQGILLAVVSKNEHENAIAGIHHPQMLLKEEDFVSIKANWEPKSANLLQMAKELTLLPESFVFADDNPAEREIVRQQTEGIAIPAMDEAEHYIRAIDRGGYFETTALSADDQKRTAMYRENAVRAELEMSFDNYEDYLRSLEMKAQIRSFIPVYMARIAQLTNKSNQFNLTTKRYTQEEIEAAAEDPKRITLYGKLEDRFGDNGVVSIVIGHLRDEVSEGNSPEVVLDIELWLMSCRVLKRNMEFAMMDTLADRCLAAGVKRIYGYYYPTAKNAMVREFYAGMGFEKIRESGNGDTVWELDLEHGYGNRNHVIAVDSAE